MQQHDSTNPESRLRERMSALVDGACASDDEFQTVLDDYAAHPVARAAWDNYHWIGDVMRASDHGVAPSERDFVAGVMARVAHTTIDPVALPPMQPQALPQVRGEAANDAVFRWKVAAGVAALAAVAAVTWQLVVGAGAQGGPQLALATPQGTQAVSTAQGVVLRDPQLEAMLAAHRQWGAASALQMPAGFLRNAAYEPAQR